MPLAVVDPEKYLTQLERKVSAFKQSVSVLNTHSVDCPVEIFQSPPSHYRLRAEFKIWHQDGCAHYAMTDPETKTPIFIDDFPVAARSITERMPQLLAAVNAEPLLRRKLFQAEFLTTLTGDTLITLIYHRPLEQDWLPVAEDLSQQLNVNLIGRSRKQKLIVGRDYVTETLSVAGRTYNYQQMEGSFTQPNGSVCEKMLAWAEKNSRNSDGDLLELYCGNGNFTLPLASNFNKVLATEISKTSVASALKNLQANAVDNVAVVRLSSEEFVQAWDEVREFRRLRHIDLKDYQFSTVFVDPPRAGLDQDTLQLVQRFNRVIYISCNPQTLLENLKTLCRTHTITALAAFDQFPYTPHLEAGVILER